MARKSAVMYSNFYVNRRNYFRQLEIKYSWKRMVRKCGAFTRHFFHLGTWRVAQDSPAFDRQQKGRCCSELLGRKKSAISGRDEPTNGRSLRWRLGEYDYFCCFLSKHDCIHSPRLSPASVTISCSFSMTGLENPSEKMKTKTVIGMVVNNWGRVTPYLVALDI